MEALSISICEGKLDMCVHSTIFCGWRPHNHNTTLSFFRVVFLFRGLDTKVLIATLQQQYYIRKGPNVKNADTISIVLALCNVQDKLIWVVEVGHPGSSSSNRRRTLQTTYFNLQIKKWLNIWIHFSFCCKCNDCYIVINTTWYRQLWQVIASLGAAAGFAITRWRPGDNCGAAAAYGWNSEQ